MIGPIDIRINAAHPNIPLEPLYAFIGSPSSVRVLGVPLRIGKWDITAVNVTITLPDNSATTVPAVPVAGCWVATLPASPVTGYCAAGLQVTADGLDENGAAVIGYCLGVGDVTILARDASVTADGVKYYFRYLDATPEHPNKGDVCSVNGVLKWYNGTAWRNFSEGIPATHVDPIGESYTMKDLKTKINEIARIISGTSSIVIACAAFAASPLEDIPGTNEVYTASETDSAIKAEITSATNSLATSFATTISNTYTKAETDARIAELAPPTSLAPATNYVDALKADLENGTMAVHTAEIAESLDTGTENRTAATIFSQIDSKTTTNDVCAIVTNEVSGISIVSVQEFDFTVEPETLIDIPISSVISMEYVKDGTEIWSDGAEGYVDYWMVVWQTTPGTTQTGYDPLSGEGAKTIWPSPEQAGDYGIKITMESTTRNALGLARLTDIAPTVSKTVTKAYVEDLGIESGVDAQTVTDIAEVVAQTSLGSFAETGRVMYAEFADSADTAIGADTSDVAYSIGDGSLSDVRSAATIFAALDEAATTNAVAAAITAATNGLVTASITNGLVTASITNGLVTASITNGLVTASITNGFVTASITNGLVTASITNGLVTASITNGLVTASITNGLVTASITNGVSNAARYDHLFNVRAVSEYGAIYSYSGRLLSMSSERTIFMGEIYNVNTDGVYGGDDVAAVYWRDFDMDRIFMFVIYGDMTSNESLDGLTIDAYDTPITFFFSNLFTLILGYEVDYIEISEFSTATITVVR